MEKEKLIKIRIKESDGVHQCLLQTSDMNAMEILWHLEAAKQALFKQSNENASKIMRELFFKKSTGE